MLFDLIVHFTYPGVFLVLLATGLGLPIPEELPIAIAALMARWDLMHWWGALLSCLAGVLAGEIGPGDQVICLGAGDITKWAAGLASAIEGKRA